jgi:endonuclease YncB( thermonuclease family)
MRRSWVLAFLFLIEGAASATPAELLPISTCLGETEQATAVDVLDARSIKLADGRVLRLAGVEPFDFYLAEATDVESELQSRIGTIAGGKTLTFRVVTTESDRYGRLPALVLIGDELIQESLMREGLAIAFVTGNALPCFDRILAAEEEARLAHRGFWKNQTLPRASPSALAARIGHFAIFAGRVRSVGNRPTRTYLNFGYRWTEDVTVEIAAADREAFGGEAKIAALAGHRLRVRGFLQEKGGPAMVIQSPMQIEVLDPAKETLGKAP